jgi:CDP-glycerol glycerophosphotransferase (TagB/SpsB family)
VHYRISRHPADTQAVNGVAFDQRSMADLLCGASAVVTRPSTVVFEAMAARKPVVIFPIFGEPLGEFAEPMHAFQLIHSPAKLAQALKRALRDKVTYRARCRPFFELHISYNPDTPATQRIVDVLVALKDAKPP